MSKQARLADGTVMEFPDDTPDEVITRTVKAHIASPKNDSAVTGLVSGALKPLDNLVTAASAIPAVSAIDEFGQQLGLPSSQQAVANNQAMRRNNTRTGWQTAGNVVGTLPTSRIPGGLIPQGAATGALLTDKTDAGGVLRDAATGALFSKLIGTTVQGAGSLIAPTVSKGKQALRDAGVTIPVSGLLDDAKGIGGSLIRSVNNGFRRWPILKGMAGEADDLAKQQYYNALVKRTGVAVPDTVPAGHETQAEVGKQLSNAYERLLPNLSATADQKLAQGLAKVQSRLKPQVTPQQYNTFLGSLQGANLTGTQGVNIGGKGIQRADQFLRTKSEDFWKAYGRTQDPAQKYLAQSYDLLRDNIRSMVLRQNPKYAPQLQQLNRQWRELALLKKAAGDPNITDGIPSAAQYARAARGSRSNQELTRAGNKYLTNRSPDSGTTEGVLLGGASGLGGFLHPATVAAPLAVAAAYTRPGTKALNTMLLAPRPKPVQTFGTWLTKSGKAVPVIVPSLLAAPAAAKDKPRR